MKTEHERVTSFAAAYLAWLERPGRMLREPDDPTAGQYGLSQELAEQLRRRVYLTWQTEIMDEVRSQKVREP